jgi:hypothetical protein
MPQYNELTPNFDIEYTCYSTNPYAPKITNILALTLAEILNSNYHVINNATII